MSEPIDWQAVSSTATPEPTAVPRAPRDAGIGEVAVAPARLGEMLEVVRAISSDMDGLRERARAAQAATVTASSGGRHVTVVRARSGSGLRVEVDERWLESAHEVAISRELLEALQGAHDEALRPAEVTDDSAMSRLRELTASPAALLQWAGLPVPPA